MVDVGGLLNRDLGAAVMRSWHRALITKYYERTIRRLRERNLRLSAEMEAATGEPIKLTEDEKRRPRDLARGIDPERLRELATLDFEDDDSHGPQSRRLLGLAVLHSVDDVAEQPERLGRCAVLC